MEIINLTGSPAYNLQITAQLIDGISFKNTDFRTASAPVQTGNTVVFMLDPSYVLPAGGQITLDYTVTIDRITADYFESSVVVKWNDSVFTNAQNPDKAESDVVVYPLIAPVVYPNPVSIAKAKDGKMKVANMVPQSVFVIYTITGEHVISLKAENTKIYWDMKNGNGARVSPGIYLYIIKNNYSKQLIKGKMFIQN
jgi:hypothetical protein